MSHSKRNTSRPVFTSHERSIAKAAWAASSARLSRDSFLPFGSCFLCLQLAIDPVSCAHGDIFCRECALSNLVAQKKEIKRQEKARAQAAREAVKAQAQEDAEVEKRAIRDFERVQAGLETPPQRKDNADVTGRMQLPKDPAHKTPAQKRKFELDDGDLDSVAQNDRQRAKKALRAEKETAAKRSLPSFWMPSLTPTANSPRTEAQKTSAQCPASSETNQHPFSLSTLVSLHFSIPSDSLTSNDHYICPSCKKSLSNASSPVMARVCGHVLCKRCINRVVLPDPNQEDMACFVCDTPFGPRSTSISDGTSLMSQSGLVELRSDGTGFSSRGGNQIEKLGVAFQC